MKKSRIAYLASEYPAISHTFIIREIQALRGQGFDIRTASIRTPDSLGKMTDSEKSDATNTLYVKDLPLIKIALAHLVMFSTSPLKYLFMLKEAIMLGCRGPRNILKGLAYFAEAGIILHWMCRNSIAHIHVHFANPAATVAMIASSYGTVSYSMSVHGPDVFYNEDQLLLAEKVKRALFVRCISYYCRSQLMRMISHSMWKKLDTVRCGIDPRIFSPVRRDDADTSEILCVGRLVPAKGQHILLEACGHLKKRGVPFRLTYVGDGDDRASLEGLSDELGLADSITFAGAVSQDEVHQYYDQADIFVLASFAEGVPVVLMEAMAKEIPSVSTCITGIPELIEDGKNGVLVAPSDTDGLADRLEELLGSESLRKKLGTEGRRKVLRRYNLAQNCEMMGDLFNRHLRLS
jgi:glycosyltransferase involved in cell wall biosynthesis